MVMEIRSVNPSELDRDAWDRFCARGYASYHCLSNNFFPAGRGLRFFEVYSPPGDRRIGQCAVRVTPHGVQFLDSLVVDPDDPNQWLPCFLGVLDSLGFDGGEIAYGSPWNMQSFVVPQLIESGAFRFIASKDYCVDAIDLCEHGEPDKLFRALNSSHRRKIRKGAASEPTLREYSGMSCLWRIPKMASLHGHTFKRKGLRHRWLTQWLSLAKNIVTFDRRATISLADHEGQCWAAMFCVQHDSTCFYVRGGTIPNNLGLSHFQHWSAIEACFRKGLRYYVMGYAYEDDLGLPSLEAQRTFKQRFRTKEHPGSIVRLRRAA